jgi:hypothetical protein
LGAIGPLSASPRDSFMDFDILHPEELFVQTTVDLGTDSSTLRGLYSLWASTNTCPSDRSGIILREQLEEEFSDFVDYTKEALNGAAVSCAVSTEADSAPPPSVRRGLSTTPLLPQALARLEGRNFEPEVVNHIRSQRVASPRQKLRTGVISAKSPFWLPAISRLGKVAWIASTSPEGFDVPADTRLCLPQDKLIANQPRDCPVDILFFKNLGPYPEHPAWSSTSIKMIVWLRE